MKKGGIGGGNTLTGLNFENKTNLLELFREMPNYSVKKGNIGWKIFYLNKHVADSYKKHDFYRFLEAKGVNWKNIVSKKLLPDDALYVILNNTLFIIEIKYQEVSGSVDEKLQTCDYKKKQYIKLLSQLNIEVEYIYILCDWFKNPRYKDVLDYIISVRCQYYFNYLPLQKIGLPIPNSNK
jgi:hypothetical protein